MLVAHRDNLGEYVERKNPSLIDLAKIIERNIWVYEQELKALRNRPNARRCACCQNYFPARSSTDVLCLICREIAIELAKWVGKIRDAERIERTKELQRRQRELKELRDGPPSDEEDEEEV